MPILGTRALARTLIDFRFSEGWDWNKPTPEGFERFSGGGCRQVYLHKDSGVVYKLDDFYSCDRGYDNRTELHNGRVLARRCRSNDMWFGSHVRIPLVSGFKIDKHLVVAMQYIEGDPGTAFYRGRAKKLPDALFAELRALGFSDMHGENFIVDADRVAWPIDMGSPRSARYKTNYGRYEGADNRIGRI